MVKHIVGLLTHLHEDIDHIGTHLPEPGVPGIELVAEHEAKHTDGVGHAHLRCGESAATTADNRLISINKS